MSGKIGVPTGTKVVTKRNRLAEVIESIVVYGELAKASARKLSKENRLSELLNLRLMIEAQFCMHLLFHLIRVPQEVIIGLQRSCVEHPNFADEVQKFIDRLLPKKGILITPDEFKKELSSALREGRMVDQSKIRVR